MMTLYQTRVWLFHQRQRQAAEIMTDFVMWHQVSGKWGLPGTLHHLQRRHNYHPQHITLLYYLLVTKHGHRMLSFTQFIFTLRWPALLLKPDRKYLCLPLQSSRRPECRKVLFDVNKQTKNDGTQTNLEIYKYVSCWYRRFLVSPSVTYKFRQWMIQKAN